MTSALKRADPENIYNSACGGFSLRYTTLYQTIHLKHDETAMLNYFNILTLIVLALFISACDDEDGSSGDEMSAGESMMMAGDMKHSLIISTLYTKFRS